MALLRYTLLRVLLFVVVTALLWLAQLRGFVLVFAAVLVSGLVSLFALRGSRDQASVALDRRMTSVRTRMAERAGAEDAWNEVERERQTRRAGSSTEPPDGDRRP